MKAIRQLISGQFSIRVLLLTIFLVAVACAGWRWWESTREWRELRHAIRTDGNLSANEKKLFANLIYDDDLSELVSRISLRRHSVNQIDMPHLMPCWDKSCSNRHVFVFSSFTFRPTVELIIMTDSEFRPLSHAYAECQGSLISATMKSVDDKIELVIIAKTMGIHTEDESIGKYRYILDDEIRTMPVKWLPSLTTEDEKTGK